jgi:hypothetical protein
MFAVFVLGVPALDAQTPQEEDSSSTASKQYFHHVEFGINAIGLGLEYRAQWFSIMSTDVVASLEQPGIGAGISFSTYGIFFLQGVLGVGGYNERTVIDGPGPFKPDFAYGWKAGVHVPLPRKLSNIFFTLGFGQMKYIQDRYRYTGGLIIASEPIEPAYRREIRIREMISVGFGMSF